MIESASWKIFGSAGTSSLSCFRVSYAGAMHPSWDMLSKKRCIALGIRLDLEISLDCMTHVCDDLLVGISLSCVRFCGKFSSILRWS